MKKNIHVLLTASCLFVNEVNSQIVIQDSVFTSTFDLYGPLWDNAIIKNCTFSNFILSDGLRIANANNIIIDSCNFYNIQGNGIRFHNAGISNNVIIQNCIFDSIYGNGINSSEGHVNTRILNNMFNNIGLDITGTAVGQPHHGIYFQGNNFLISGNRINAIYNNNGNCISVRSNGTVRNNILSNATKNGIATGLVNYPLFDFENDIREPNRLDAGADQLETTLMIYSSGIDENIAFPNPAKDKIDLTIEVPLYTVKLLNSMGQVVMKGENINSVDLSFLSKGTYLLLVESDKFIKKQKIIVY